MMSLDLRIDSLIFTYPSGVTALRGISLVIAAGEAVAIIGQNGSGKTTLVKHFNGLLRPTSGVARVGEWDTREKSVAQLSARVGYVFQNPDEQLFQRTLQAEVMFGPKNLGCSSEQAAARAGAALRRVGLSAEAARHPYDLAPVQRRWVALAAVLAMETPVIILDEPTMGQDDAGLELIGRIVADLKRQGRTVITISHDIDFCAEHFERVIVMAEGQILLDGPTRAVLAEDDRLARAYVDPPQLARLARRLGMETTPLTVEEFVEQATRCDEKPDG